MTLAAPFHALPQPRHKSAAAGLLALVLLGHAWLLGAFANAWPAGPAAAAAQGQRPRPLQVQVRHRVQVPAAQALAAGAALAVGAVAPATAVASTTPTPSTPSTPSIAPVQPPVPTQPQIADTPAAEPSPAPTDPEESAAPPPVYSTRLPPPVSLQYSVRRGLASGVAELQWQSAEGRYQVRLHSQIAGKPAVGWASQGNLDAAGIAPGRYTESRRGRELRAANFQREAGRISFSEPTLEYPLVEGAQDRLSWMIQLGAVLAANPDLAETGSQVSLFVAGTRGDARTWVFTVLGQEPLQLPDGTLTTTVHLHREPARPYDTQVDVWLDPARHHLPARMHLRTRGGGEGLEFELQDLR